MEGYLKKKSPKTQGKHIMDVWQKRYFVLSDAELKYYKTEKAASSSDAEPLKSIAMAQVLAAVVNPRHADMFVVDLGAERKVKLQAADEAERDAWVNAIEKAKLRSWKAQEQASFDEVAAEARRAGGGGAAVLQSVNGDHPLASGSGGGGGGDDAEEPSANPFASTSSAAAPTANPFASKSSAPAENSFAGAGSPERPLATAASAGVDLQLVGGSRKPQNCCVVL